MKFRVERDALGDAVAWVARALPSRPVVPVLAGLLLEAADGALVLSCFDYEVSARVQIDAEVDDPGTALVPGRLLAEITRSLPSRPAEFTSDPDAVSLTCGGAEFTLVSLPIEDFPALPEPPSPAGTIDGGTLAAAAGQVVPAASRDDTLPMLTGVCIDFDGATMTLAATDRYRLAVREVHWQPSSPDLRAAALVPARTLAEVARTMAAGVPVSIAFGDASDQDGDPDSAGRHPGGEPRPAEGMISFDGGGRRLTVRLIAGEFIRYQSRFPSEFGCRAEVPAVAFTEAVRRVSLVAERATPVRLTFGAGAVVIEAQAEGRARAIETVPADFEGAEPVIAFNPHYLL
ncbi:MAG: DNA polymerase III subunit beta, partial [Actinomycetota bacterium]